MTSALETAKEVFAWAGKCLPPDCELEVYHSSGRGRSILWSEKKLEEISREEGGGFGVRVIHESRQGYAFSQNLGRDRVEQTARRALEAASLLPPDRFRKLPAALPRIEMKGNIFDPGAFSGNSDSYAEHLKEGESLLLKSDPLLKSVLRAGFSEGMSETAIVNSAGIEAGYSATHCGLGVSCLAEKDGERQEGGFGMSRCFGKDLDWDLVFKKAGERASSLLGSKPVETAAIPVVFDPSIACEFLSLVSSAVSADSIQKGKSFFCGKMGEMVAGNNITIYDDGTMDKGLGSSPVDDEGIPTRKTSVISNGKLNGLLYDTYTALKDGTSSTGNAGRAGYKSSPAPGASNFYLCAGTDSPGKLLSQTRGLYLLEVMGLHMADPISGDFSVGAIGRWLENGEFKHGVRGVTLAGNLLTMLKNIDAVCDDLTFFGSLGSPTFRVRELTLSG